MRPKRLQMQVLWHGNASQSRQPPTRHIACVTDNNGPTDIPSETVCENHSWERSEVNGASIEKTAPECVKQWAVGSSATFSLCSRYRYVLGRGWDEDKPVVMFVGLNPSTADAVVDDPTIRRCIGFAQRWGYGSLVMTNLFAFRSTDPSRLGQVKDPVGPENDEWLRMWSDRVDLIVVAWGCHGHLFDRDAHVLETLPETFCLGLTKDGHPRHPLYLAADTKLQPYS